MKHDQQSPLAGQTVKIKETIATLGSKEFRVEDWNDRVLGKSWMHNNGNPACLQYAMRSGFSNLPVDNEVLYGKIDGIGGFLVHVSELDIENPSQTTKL